MRLKIFITLVLVGAMVVGAQYLGSIDSTKTASQRSRNLIQLQTLNPPYTWMDTVNVDSANYTVPDSVKVCELRFLKPGLYQMQLTRSASRPYRADSSDIMRVELQTIYKTGTDTAGRHGSIRLFGVIE